ncbi:MAG: class II fructose-bisphosphate aldolase [Reichenbachiella sp.]|uniref:class II fructose-bisphosphate aldolase n=1 Tax=Reichenbachiella sp. TaxID=2184521 RepID=UPI0029670D64|nr:class II fructose-bisphosphate aldolase [Reichenbachiella sp.]MDW3212194.1 class II fructose-bisphosphate aldolase [Reichenbachiella sp.]
MKKSSFEAFDQLEKYNRMKLTTGQLFEKCYGKYAIAAVNVFTMEQVLGLFSAAQKCQAPFIVQTTPVARNYAEADMLLAMIDAAARIYPETVYAVHLDHGVEDHAMDAIASGKYTSVMIDASHEDFDRNVARTKPIVEAAHLSNISVEAELGVLSGVEDNISIEEKHAKYTNPDDVVEFVNQTQCDSLAIAVGTSHGAYKFSGGQGLQFDILKEIQERLPGFPLVLHGGSAVNEVEIEAINKYGGKLNTNAKGVDPEELKASIQYGICKVNIATDTRLIWTRVHREFFHRNPEQFDPIVPGKVYIEEQRDFLASKFDLLGATGRNKDF